MSHMKYRLAAILLALTLTVAINSLSFAQESSNSDQTTVELVNNIYEVNNAQNFALWIDPATPKPSSWAAASFGYLGAFLGSDESEFFQVGYNIDPTGVRWFAWSNTPGIACDHGYIWYSGGGVGCYGDYNSYASLDAFHMIQLDTNLNGTWQAFVYDAQGRGIQVAHKYFGTNVLYKMYTSSEESWNSSDPYIMVRYYHFHPKYYKYPNGWTNWPATNGGSNNYLSCPSWTPYAAVINLTGDPMSWFAGTGGTTCYQYGLW
jgi:hypothetical protein